MKAFIEKRKRVEALLESDPRKGIEGSRSLARWARQKLDGESEAADAIEEICDRMERVLQTV